MHIMKFESMRCPGVEEGVDYVAFSAGCKTVRQQTVEEVSSGEGVVCLAEFCQRAARL